MRRLFYLCALLNLLTCCKPEDPREDAPLLKRWDRKQPLGLYLSKNLAPCQVAGMHAAEAYWEALTGENLILYTATVEPTDVSMSSATRQAYVIAVTQAPMYRPDALDQAELFSMQHSEQFLHSVEIRVQGCSVWAFTHELGHALGLGHAVGSTALMQPTHAPDAWDVSVKEIRLVKYQL